MSASSANQTNDSDSLPALQHLTQLQHQATIHISRDPIENRDRALTAFKQLTALRTLLPSTVTPLLSSTAHPSPEALYTQFASSAVSALASVRSFRAAWEDEETGRVLKQVRASLAKNGREGAGARWWDSEMAGQGSMEKVDALEEVGKVEHRNSMAVEVQREKRSTESEALDVVEAFRKRRPNCTVEYRSLSEPIKICVRSSLQQLNFIIHATDNTEGVFEYNTTVVGTSKLLDSITRCLESRIDKTDLVYTLDFIAAYSNLGARKCDKCKRKLDSSALVPTWRRKPQARNQEEDEKEWEAVHEGCQD